MLYNVNSPYYRQFLSSTVNKKYQKNLEKQQGIQAPQGSENRGNVNPSSVGVWFVSYLYFYIKYRFDSNVYTIHFKLYKNKDLSLSN